MTFTTLYLLSRGFIVISGIVLFFIGGVIAFDGLRTFSNKRLLLGFVLLLLDIAVCLAFYLLGVFA